MQLIRDFRGKILVSLTALKVHLVHLGSTYGTCTPSRPQMLEGKIQHPLPDEGHAFKPSKTLFHFPSKSSLAANLNFSAKNKMICIFTNLTHQLVLPKIPRNSNMMTRSRCDFSECSTRPVL